MKDPFATHSCNLLSVHAEPEGPLWAFPAASFPVLLRLTPFLPPPLLACRFMAFLFHLPFMRETLLLTQYPGKPSGRRVFGNRRCAYVSLQARSI